MQQKNGNLITPSICCEEIKGSYTKTKINASVKLINYLTVLILQMARILLYWLFLLLYFKAGFPAPHFSCQLREPVNKNSLLKFKQCLDHYLTETTLEPISTTLDISNKNSRDSKLFNVYRALLEERGEHEVPADPSGPAGPGEVMFHDDRPARALADNYIVPFVGQPFWVKKRNPKPDLSRLRDARAAEPADISEMLQAYKEWRQLHGYGNGGGRWGR